MEVTEQAVASVVTRFPESSPSTAELPPREIGVLGSGSMGPTLIALGSVHGNEPAGYLALRRVVEVLEAEHIPLQGEFVALVGNRHAAAMGVRFVDEDLNRAWSAERLAELRAGDPPVSVEESEMAELEAEIDRALERAPGEAWLLDLHTTSGFGPPFGVLDDTLPNRKFAGLFDVPYVVGLEEELDGTVLSHYVARGVRTFGFESGQHDMVDAVDRAEAAVWIALVGLGLVAAADVRDLSIFESRLRAGTEELPRVVEVRYRHNVEAEDGFRMNPGFVSFQPIKQGQELSRDRHGPVKAPEGGRLLMPLYQAQGQDGFFVIRQVSRFWMWLSSVLRRLRAERFLHWLPGIRRAPAGLDSFIVDRRVARWFALQLLHLMGFRRHGRSGQYLVVSRRPNDRTITAGPQRSDA